MLQAGKPETNHSFANGQRRPRQKLTGLSNAEMITTYVAVIPLSVVS
jgi:hypothetical protein